jgi:multicomponent Na+:H+ antiporter subunit F
MFNIVLYIALLGIAIAMVGLVYRVIKGPTIPDRVIALDGLGINLVAIIAILSIILRTSAFLDIMILIGLLAFIGTVAFSKFLEKGEILESDRNL